MPVKYILQQTGFKMGLDPDISGERAVLLRFLNEAAMELYDESDLDGVLKEQVFRVDGDQQIVFPAYVGPLRAMREVTTYIPWHLNKMRPRYAQSNWQDRWRNWRIKGYTPLLASVTNGSIAVITIPEVEANNVVVTLTGRSDVAAYINEEVVLSETSNNGTVTFDDYFSIKKDRVNAYDITVSDVDGNVLSIIPNNMLEARYRLFDVSAYPWSNAASNSQDHYMEVLYKEALPWLNNDGDEFVVPGFDNILINKMLQLWMEEQGKADAALAYDSKATRGLARKKNDANRGAEEGVSFVENPHDNLLLTNRSNRPATYSKRIYY